MPTSPPPRRDLRYASVVLDSEAFSRWIIKDRAIVSLIERMYRRSGSPLVSANTIIEVTHPRVDRARLDWLLSRVRIEPVTKDAARRAAALLAAAGLHGHQHAIDATVADVALRAAGPAVVVTSDPDDFERLCGDRVYILPI